MEVEGLRMPAFVGLCATARDGLLRENHRRSGERAAGVQTLCGNDLAPGAAALRATEELGPWTLIE